MPAPDIEAIEPTAWAPDPTTEDGFDEWADEIDDRPAAWDIDDDYGHPSGCDTAEEYRGLR